MEGFIVILVLGLICTGIFFNIYTLFDHWDPKDGKTLKPGARITGIDTKRFNKYKFKTTINFDDGFKYVTFKTKSSYASYNSTFISVDNTMKNAFMDKARNKHDELLAAYTQRMGCQHEWVSGSAVCTQVCSKCGELRPAHQWNGCRCSVCGETRDEEHKYIALNGRCVEQCTVCGKERSIAHKFGPDGVCTVCGEKSEAVYSLADLTVTELDSVKQAVTAVRTVANIQEDTKTKESCVKLEAMLANSKTQYNRDEMLTLSTCTLALLKSLVNSAEAETDAKRKIDILFMSHALSKLNAKLGITGNNGAPE